MIEAVIYSYKNKNLKAVVDNLINNTNNQIVIKVYDQHNLDREKLFHQDGVEYGHIFWDEIKSPAEYKSNIVHRSEADYLLVMSDDILVKKDWDIDLIKFLDTGNLIISGSGKLKITQENPFYLTKNYSPSDLFNKTNFVDKNFIFAKTDSIRDIYPAEVKYNGEEEMLSLSLFYKKIEIFSCPTGIYKDLQERTMETKYIPFSINHAYNLIVERIKAAPKEFFELLNILPEKVNRLPFGTDDVLYDPYKLDFQDVDGRKFIIDVKEIS